MGSKTETIITVLEINAEQAAAGARKFAAAADETAQALGKLAGATDQTETTLSNSAKATARFAREAENLYRGLNPVYEAQIKLSDQQKKLNEAMETTRRQMAGGTMDWKAGQERIDAYAKASRDLVKVTNELSTGSITHSDAMLRMNTVMNTSAQHATNFQRSAKLTANEVTNLTYQIQDAAVQLAGGQNPLLILMQQGPQATGAVGGVGRALSLLATPTTMAAAGLAAVAGAGALVVSRAVEISGHTRQLTVDLQAMGNVSGATATQLHAIEAQLRQMGVSGDDAFKAVRSLTGAQLPAGVLGDVANIGRNLGASTGDVAGAVKMLTDALSQGYSGIVKLDQSFNFLTADERNAIDIMARHGDQAGALATAIAALHRQYDGLHEKGLSPAGAAMEKFTAGYNRLMDAIASRPLVIKGLDALALLLDKTGQSLGGLTRSERITQIQGELKNLETEYARLPEKTTGIQATHEANIKRRIELQTELNKLTKEEVAENSPWRNGGPRIAGTSEARTGPYDPAAAKYVGQEKIAYEALSEAMSGNRAERSLLMADMRAEQEIRDKKLKGQDAEDLRTLRHNEALLQLSTTYRDQLQDLSLAAQGNVKLADAYGLSMAAAVQQKAANDAVAAAAGNAAVNVAELTRQNVASAAAQALAGLAEQNAQLDLQARLLPAVTAATKNGIPARLEAERAMQVQIATSQALAAADAAEAQGNFVLAAKLREVAAAYADKSKRAAGLNQSDALEKMVSEQARGLEYQRLEISLIGKSATERAHILALYQAEQRIKELGIDASKALNDEDARRVATIRQQAVEMSDLTLEAERQRQAYDDLADACEFPDDVQNDPTVIAAFEEIIR